MPPVGETKQGFIITIVILSLLVVTLGVTTYLGYSGQTALAEKVRDQETKTKAMTGSRDWEQFKALQLLAYSGYARPADYTAAAAGHDKFKANQLGGQEQDKAYFSEILAKLDDPKNGLGWDQQNHRPLTTYEDERKRFNAENAGLQAKLEAAKKDYLAKLDELRGLLKTNEEQKAVLTSRLTETEARLAALVNSKAKEFNDAMEMLADRDQQIVALKKEGRARADDDQKKITDLEKQTKDMRRATEKLREQIAPTDLIKLDEPRGRVASVRRGFVYINLGSADNVKPQLTFSVFGVGTDGKAQGERKGGLEVVSVLESHLSVCRVIDIADPGANPILTGDLIFNPAWTPGLRQHIALAGLIDLTGDGRDSTEQFINDLKRQGIVVDGYIDVRDGSVTGGVTGQTNYLVVGDIPKFSAAAQMMKSFSGAGKQDPATIKKDIAEHMTEFQTEANRLGVQIVPVRRFLTMIGYRVPRVPVEANYDDRLQNKPTEEVEAQQGPREGKTDLREPASRDKEEMEGKDDGKNPFDATNKRPAATPKAKKAKPKPADEKDKDKGDDDKPDKP